MKNGKGLITLIPKPGDPNQPDCRITNPFGTKNKLMRFDGKLCS